MLLLFYPGEGRVDVPFFLWSYCDLLMLLSTLWGVGHWHSWWLPPTCSGCSNDSMPCLSFSRETWGRMSFNRRAVFPQSVLHGLQSLLFIHRAQHWNAIILSRWGGNAVRGNGLCVLHCAYLSIARERGLTHVPPCLPYISIIEVEAEGFTFITIQPLLLTDHNQWLIWMCVVGLD